MKLNWQSFGKLAAISAVLQVAAVQQSFASGFEKGIMWGARSAGVAGIATPYIAGAQALYFNPAGLASDKEGQDVSLNISPTFLHFEAPIGNTNTQSTSDTIASPASLIYSRTFGPNLGVGAGFFTTAGANVQYTGVGNAQLGTVNTNIAVNEFSVGAGYKINDAWRVGAAYRIAFTRANFSLLNNFPGSGGTVQVNTQANDLKGTNFDGFRLGTQYKVAEHTTLGLDFRSEMNINAVGTQTQNAINSTSGATTYGAINGATVRTTLPMQINLGVQQEYTSWRTLAEYVYTQYSRVGDVHIDAAAATQPSNNIKFGWNDEHQIRLGGEYLGTSWPIRFGYALTSQVTNSDYPYAAFAPAALAHTVTVGTGQIFQVGSNPLQVDVAGEYTRSSASTGRSASGDTTSDYRSGDYKLSIMTLHAGVTYAF